MDQPDGFIRYKRIAFYVLVCVFVAFTLSVYDVLAEVSDYIMEIIEVLPISLDDFQRGVLNNRIPLTDKSEGHNFDFICETDLKQVFPVLVGDYWQGNNLSNIRIEPIHSTPDSATGIPEDTYGNVFFSLGFEGYIVLDVGQLSYNPYQQLIMIFETSPGNKSCEENPEYAKISVSDGSRWDSLGTICQSGGFLLRIRNGTNIRFIKVTDYSSQNIIPLGEDGYDLDGIAISICESSDIILPTVTLAPSLVPSSTEVAFTNTPVTTLSITGVPTSSMIAPSFTYTVETVKTGLPIYTFTPVATSTLTPTATETVLEVSPSPQPTQGPIRTEDPSMTEVALLPTLPFEIETEALPHDTEGNYQETNEIHQISSIPQDNKADNPIGNSDPKMDSFWINVYAGIVGSIILAIIGVTLKLIFLRPQITPEQYIRDKIRRLQLTIRTVSRMISRRISRRP